MKTFIASRLLEGNRLFPNEIHISESGVTMKVPGFLSSKEETILFSKISSVNIKTPMIGFSSITITTNTREGEITSSGFLKEEVIEMKSIILNKINQN